MGGRSSSEEMDFFQAKKGNQYEYISGIAERSSVQLEINGPSFSRTQCDVSTGGDQFEKIKNFFKNKGKVQ